MTTASNENKIASISASSMTSMLSSRPSVSKPHDNSVKREQNPHDSHYNGLTRESRGNGGGLRPRVWLRLRAAAGGNWTPMESRNWKAKPILLVLDRKRTQKLLCMGLFSEKLNGPLLTGSHVLAEMQRRADPPLA